MRIRTPSLLLSFVLAAATAATGCRSQGARAGSGGVGPTGTTSDLSLNRGDWLMGEQIGIWKILSQPRSGAPERIGYLSQRNYREVRGGPVFSIYEVTSLDRNQQLGIVDSLGNATRYRPRRGGGFDAEDAGNASLELSIGAIFQTVRPILLEKTTEHALTFEVLDTNHDGFLDKNEFPRITDRVRSPDKNRDAKRRSQSSNSQSHS